MILHGQCPRTGSEQNAEMAPITHATRAARAARATGATIDTLKMTQAQTVNQATTPYRYQRTNCSHHA